MDAKQVRGVGFDATCSLAVVDREGKAVNISRSPEDGAEDDAALGKLGDWNVILWADHRAEVEAEEINASGEGVLRFVGGTMSVSEAPTEMTRACHGNSADGQLEMEAPKTLWLKKHMPANRFKDCLFFEYVPSLLFPNLRQPPRLPHIPRNRLTRALQLLTRVQVQLRASWHDARARRRNKGGQRDGVVGAFL